MKKCAALLLDPAEDGGSSWAPAKDETPTDVLPPDAPLSAEVLVGTWYSGEIVIDQGTEFDGRFVSIMIFGEDHSFRLTELNLDTGEPMDLFAQEGRWTITGDGIFVEHDLDNPYRVPSYTLPYNEEDGTILNGSNIFTKAAS